MEELNLKMYYKILLKNWVWIVSVVLLTLIVSLIVKLGFTKAPFPEYSTSIIIDVSAVVFSDKTVVNSTFSIDELENFAVNAAKSINVKREDFATTFTNPTPSSTKIEFKTKNEDMLESFIKGINSEISKEIIKRNLKSPDGTVNKLNDYYKSKITGTDGKISLEILNLISTDPNKQNEIKPIEIIAGEKVTAELARRLAEANEVLAKASSDQKNENDKLSAIITNISSFDTNIKDYNILLSSLKLKNLEKNVQNDLFVSNQITYMEENLALFNSYKTYYSNAKIVTEENLKQNNIMVANAIKQVDLQSKELNNNKGPLVEKIANHNSQIELIKVLNNIYLDNETLNSKIISTTSEIKKLVVIDARKRSVIISTWLAFVLMCCLVLLKEYFIIGKKNKYSK